MADDQGCVNGLGLDQMMQIIRWSEKPPDVSVKFSCFHLLFFIVTFRFCEIIRGTEIAFIQIIPENNRIPSNWENLTALLGIPFK